MSEETLLSPLTPDRYGQHEDPITAVFPTTKNVIRLPFQVTKQFLEEFSETYPGYKATGNTMKHPHPHLSVDRKVMEEIAVRMLRRYGDGWILDVGGSSVRHHRLRRQNIWSCQPLVDPEDRNRGFRSESACRHRVHECYCKAYDTVMLIHSLYYITPEMLLDVLVRTTYKLGVAVVHLFPERSGTLGFGEASYISESDKIEMHVKGNYHTYVHDNIAWLKSQSINSRGLTLSWTIINISHHSSMLAFRVHAGVVKTLSRFLEQESYDEITIRTQVKRGVSVFKWHEEHSVTALIPKRLIVLLQRQRIGRPANTQTYQLLVHTALRFLKEAKVGEHDIGRLMLVAVVHVMECDAALETGLLTELMRHHEKHEDLAELLAFPKRNRTWLDCFPHHSAVAGFLVPWQLQCLLSLTKQLSHRPVKLLPAPPLPESRFDDPVTYTDCKIEDITSPRTHDLVESKVPLTEIDSTAKISYDVAAHRPPSGTLKPLGITFGGCAPVAYASNLQNEIISVNNRGLLPKPKHDVRKAHLMKRWLKNSFDLLFPERREIVPDFEAWNSRYPLAQRKRHERAVRSGGTTNLEKRKAFVKVEKLLFAKQGEVIDKPPRLIQGAVDEYNVEIGPWMHAFSKELIRLWNKDFIFYYPSGASNEDIGNWLELDLAYYEDDFSKFDATIHHNLLEMELFIYRTFGMPTNMQKLVRKNFPTVGATPHGVSYMVEGTRKSGDQNTSVGNTMLNVLVHAYAMHMLGFTPRYDINTSTWPYRMIALGDDNLIVTGEPIAHVNVENIIKDLGLIPNMVFKDNVNLLEFCSARFWPSETGRVLGPKIGRYLAKIGWMLRPPVGESRQAKEYRGTLLSHVETVNHIPILKEVTQRILDVMAEKRFIKDTELKGYVIQPHQVVTETYSMIHDLYDISASDVEDLLAIVARVERLPAEINHWTLSKFFERDC